MPCPPTTGRRAPRQQAGVAPLAALCASALATAMMFIAPIVHASGDPARALIEAQKAIRQAVAQKEQNERKRRQEAARKAAQEAGQRKQQEQRDAHAARQQAARQEHERLCGLVRSWWNQAAVPAHPGGRPSPEAIVALLQPERFEPAFGKRYEDLTPVELQKVSAYAGRCFQPQGTLADMPAAERQMITHVLMPSYRTRYLQYLEDAASADEALRRLAAEALTLRPDEEGAQRWFSIATEAGPLLSTATSRSRDIFQANMRKTDAAVIATVLPGLVDDALAQAEGLEGLERLARQTVYGVPSNRYVFLVSPEGRDVRAESHRRLRDGMKALGARIAEAERQRIDAWDEGLAALSRGVAWRADYQARLAPYSTPAPSLQELLDHFHARREQALRDSRDDFERLVGQADSHADLAGIRARFLLDDDKRATAGTALIAIVNQRAQAIDRAAALGRAAASSSSDTGPSSSRRAGDTGESVQAEEDADGGPTEEIMYELLRSVLVNGTQRQNELMARCGSGPRPDDPAMNQVCLGVMLYRGVTAGLTSNAPVPKILEFEKLGCAPAAGKPGYFCEYMLAVEKQLNPAFVGAEAKALLEGPALKSARFVRSRSKGWYIIHTEDSLQ